MVINIYILEIFITAINDVALHALGVGAELSINQLVD